VQNTSHSVSDYYVLQDMRHATSITCATHFLIHPHLHRLNEDSGPHGRVPCTGVHMRVYVTCSLAAASCVTQAALGRLLRVSINSCGLLTGQHNRSNVHKLVLRVPVRNSPWRSRTTKPRFLRLSSSPATYVRFFCFSTQHIL